MPGAAPRPVRFNCSPETGRAARFAARQYGVVMSRTPMRLLGRLFAGGSVVPLTGRTRIVATALALPLAAFEIWLAFVGLVTPVRLGLFFVVPLLIIAFLTTTGSRERTAVGVFEVAMAGIVAVAGAYLIWHSDRYGQWILGISRFTLWDQIAGAVMILGTLVIMKRTVGPGMLAVVLILVAYLAFGDRLEGFLYHRHFSLREIIEQSIISNNGGLFGTPVAAAAMYVYLFVLFGKFLQVSGGGQFFFDLAARLAGRRVGGVAKVSVVSSGLFGMISGSPTSDVVTTGTITIPMMKRMGYPAYLACAIETVSSVGGSFLPPVMGAVVFLMIEFTGIPYSEVIGASVLIALLYYFAIYLQVHQISRRDGVGDLGEAHIPTFGRILATGWIYVVPVVILVVLIEQGRSPQYSVAVSLLAIVAFSWLSRDRTHRIGPLTFVRTVTDAAVIMAPLMAAVAGAGLVEQVLNVTGIGSKISFQLFDAAGGEATLILLFAAVVTIVFGMGMPVPAVYSLAAILLAPGLIQAGFGLLQSHLFLVWFSVASHLTPPIAVAAYVAAAVGQAPPMKVSVWASRLGMVAFLLPFIFMVRPGVLMQADLPTIVLDAVLTACAILMLASASVAFFAAPIAGWMRLVLTGLALVAAFAVALPWAAVAAAVAGLLLLAGNWLRCAAPGRAKRAGAGHA